MPISQTVLASPVIAAAIALLAFIPSAAYFYILRKNKANAAISLVLQYAKYAEENTAQWLKGFDGIRKYIEDGDPYGKDYTPLICSADSTDLSFEQMSEIRRYLTPTERVCLFEYYMIQADVDATIGKIHTDFARSFPPKRKIVLWDHLKGEAEELREKAGELAKELGKRKGVAEPKRGNKSKETAES